MNDDLRQQILGNLNLKETDELVEIWQTNDRVDWSGEAFDAIRQILTNRGVNIPEQDKPVYEHVEEEDVLKIYGYTEEELKIVEAEDQPVFYDPLDVLHIKKRIELAATGSVFLIVTSTVLRFPESQNMMKGLLQAYPPLAPLSFPLTVISAMIAVLMVVIATYFPLKALASILRILMEMEFTSRK